MTSASPKRTRVERVQSLPMAPSGLQRLLQEARHGRLWGRLLIAIGAAALMVVVCQAWRPPFSYRSGYVPARELVARVEFEVPDLTQTAIKRRETRREVEVFYRNRSQPLTQLREALKDQLFLVLEGASLEQLPPEGRRVWGNFYAGDESAAPDEGPTVKFSALKATLADDLELRRLDEAVRKAMQPFYEHGLLRSLSHDVEEGNQSWIRVYSGASPEDAERVEVNTLRIVLVSGDPFEERLQAEFRQSFSDDPESAAIAAGLVHRWLSSRLPETLTYDAERSQQAREEAAAKVATEMNKYFAGTSSLAPAGRPLGREQLELLTHEWEHLRQAMGWGEQMVRVAAYLGMIVALYLLCGGYIYFVDDRRLLLDPVQLARMLGLVVVTVAAARIASREAWQAEVIPLVLAAITAAVAYGRELAILLLAATSLAVTLFIGHDLADLVVSSAAALSCILLLGRIRSRTKLVWVGIGAAAVTAATVIGVGIVTGPTLAAISPDVSVSLNRSLFPETLWGSLLRDGLWTAGRVLVAALAMTGLLPIIEKLFGVQTDLSLFELGDASHPLLRQLAQRAPGTYNHSINVASIAEAAAERIGANGLLVRVGAYFHDIGKMFKPEYFIENQGLGRNHHDSLQPAMSTLVIIAHVKDGADLARSHHLPEPMIDFILQHHGTTLVEYFYLQAARKCEEDPSREVVSDKDFRYPGPKPQTLEAAILMLADTVESASRALVEPTPARIKSLVDQMAMKKLTDGQFDECGLTLRQLDRVKQSLVKSLTAIYHARVKYPGQQSA